MFCPFARSDLSSADAKSIFCKAMRAWSRNPEWGAAIAAIIEDGKHSGIRLSVWSCYSGAVLKFHVVCSQDPTLFHWANELKRFPLGFPRGFAVVVERDTATVLALSCFYPKFGNDTPDNMKTTVRDVSAAHFYLKYSGSLSMVCFFRHPVFGNCWSVSSKNSADCSPDSYPTAMMRILTGAITKDLVERCIADGISFATETMLPHDQTHGYSTRKGYIATCVHSQERQFTHTERARWCRDNGLVHDEPGVVTGSNKVQSFIHALVHMRDFITLETLEALFHAEGIRYDTSNHTRLVLSNVVEGLVIHFAHTDGSTSMLKLKFTMYLMVTMYLRPFCQGKIGRSPDDFIARWVAPINAEAWRMLIGLCHSEVIDRGGFEGKFNTVSKKAQWIYASECVYGMLPLASLIEQLPPPAPADSDGDDLVQQLNQICLRAKSEGKEDGGHTEPSAAPLLLPPTIISSTSDATAIIVLGPIGWGKSAMGKHLAALNPELYEHVDGDEPPGIESFGPERNRYTCAIVLGVIAQHKIPIVSCGGGALLFAKSGQYDEQPYIIEYARRCGVKLHLVAFVPTDKWTAFNDTASVRRIVEERRARGARVWNSLPDGKIDFVCMRSYGNLDITNRFMHVAQSVKQYDRVHWDAATGQSVIGGNDAHLDDIRQYRFIGSVRCNILCQLYACEEVTNALLHRTLHFSEAVQSVSVPELTYAPVDSACLVTCFTASGCERCRFIKLPFSPEAHLTVSAGQYKPMSMKAFCRAVDPVCVSRAKTDCDTEGLSDPTLYTATNVVTNYGETLTSVTFKVQTRRVIATPLNLCVLFHKSSV